MAAKRPPDEIQAERFFVDLPPPEYNIVPSVQLEQRHIKMTYISASESVGESTSSGEQSVPSILSNGNKGIVGEERLLGQESFSQVVSSSHQVQTTTTTTKTTTATEHNEGKSTLLSVEYKTQATHVQDTVHAEVLEFFEEQDKTFKEQVSVQPQKKKARSPSPSPVRQSVGLDHLDNLVKLMEQLSSLRDENVKLKKKCAYLESTKSLLEVKSALEQEIMIQSEQKLEATSQTKLTSRREIIPRQRLPSAEDAGCLDLDETRSYSSKKRPKHSIHKRSNSTSSLDIQCEEEVMKKLLSNSYEKGTEAYGQKGSKSPLTKRKTKMPNWGKLKIMGFRLKSIKDFGRGSLSSKELSVPSGALENRSVDSGVGSGVEADPGELMRKSTSSGEPASPTCQSSPQSRSQKEMVEEEDFSTDIWMGDPDWLEKHEGEMSDPMFTKEVIVLNSAQKLEDEQYLQVPIPRRKSSPSLLDESPIDIEVATEYLNLRRSSSYKGRSSHGDVSEVKDVTSPKIVKKISKPTWGKRVKHIVHTRKDSIKKRLIRKGLKSETDQSGGEELSEMDHVDAFEEMKRMYIEQEGPLGRSTPKTSPLSIPRGYKAERDDEIAGRSYILPKQTSVDLEAIIGGMSDDFSKKMEQWEEKKNRSSSTARADVSEGNESNFPDSIGTISPEFQKKLDEWERSKSIKLVGESSGKSDRLTRDSREGSPDGVSPGPDCSTQSVNIDELQRKLTESFNRKLEEWERRKYRRESGSPVFDRKDSTGKSISRKEDRQSSRKQKVDKDKGKLERRRERELQRVEREEQKLEKERIRIEKERLRALEREARIEKMKGRLSQPDMETKFRNPILSPLTEYKVTTDFARKLYEWELRKGGTSAMSMATYLETQHRTMEQSGQTPDGLKKDSFGDDAVFESPTDKEAGGVRPPPLTLQPCFDSPEETSPCDKSSDVSFGDDTSVTTESFMDSNIASSLEKANNKVMEKLHDKEIEYESLQEEVRQLTDKLSQAKVQHSKEIEKYKQECIAGWQPGQTSPPQITAMTTQLTELESKIGELRHFGENLAMSMESAAVCKWQSMEGQESVNTRLVELLEQMRTMLLQASESEEATQKSSALKSFEKLYRQAMQLQVQLSNLRLSQLERNKEIMTMKRHLLLQEANNLLLQADITRREADLHKYKAASKGGKGIKRWNTYGGMEARVVESEETEYVPPYKRFTKSRKPAVASQSIVMETTEPNTSEDTSKDESSLSKDHSGELLEMKPLNSLAPLIDHSKDLSHLTADIEYIDECSSEIDHIEQIEKVETEDSIKVSHGSNQSIKIERDKGLEISMTIKLPTANISLPRDFSQQELTVPRSSSAYSTESSPISEQDVTSQSDISSSQSEAKFPELLIPEWHKSAKKCPPQLTKMKSIDFDPNESRPRLESDEVKKSLQSDETSDIPSVSQSLEETTGDSSFEPDAVFVDSASLPPLSNIQQRKLVHSAPTSQSGRLDFQTRTIADVHSPTSLSPVLGKRSTHPPAHWPRVRHVSSAHRIKPAEELLEESRRYRKGHSVYMTRILQKYASSDETGKYLISQKIGNKENIKEGYVKSIVKRLSRESTPEYNQRVSELTPKALSSISIQRSDSPRSKSEFVQHIVQKLSSPSSSAAERAKSIGSPLSDLTNGGGRKVRQLAEAFDSPRTTPDRALSDNEGQTFKSVLVTGKRITHEIRDSWYDSSSTLTSQSMSVTEPLEIHKPESSISSTVNFSSMPLLSVQEEGPTDTQNGYRERASTTATCENNGNGKGQSEKDLHVTITTVSPETSIISSVKEEKKHVIKRIHIPKSSKSKKVEIHFAQQKAGQKPGGRGKMGTIGVLCQQTMLSFDLGLSLQASEQEKSKPDEQVKVEPQSPGGSQISPRPLSSSSSEGEKTPSSPQDRPSRSRTKFFETSWLQKKFFKVSNKLYKTTFTDAETMVEGSYSFKASS